jgi:AbrB family looped-hinge helix DNA binding protein
MAPLNLRHKLIKCHSLHKWSLGMLSMKISEGGRVVIPVEIRRALNLKDGDSVLWDLVDGQARLSTQRSQLEQARALFQQFCPPQTNGQQVAQFIADRRAEGFKE